ncbi:MAG: hypothetical protein HY236_09465, partial [Acidobacteria bacterium]|nr:hypothetical protein [Acidobacteriota bacterium]
TGESLNSLPVISTRKFSSAVRVREGESSIISGLAVVQTSRSTSGPAGLSQIPMLGRLFRSSTRQLDQDELLLTITPHLTSLPPAEQFPSRAFATGTESRMAPAI